MAIGDIGICYMAKRQKTEIPDKGAKRQRSRENLADDTPSDEKLGVIIAATRTPDMNIVDFSDTVSDVEICPEPVPLSDSELPQRRKKHKRKKTSKHSKDRKTETLKRDDEESLDLDSKNTSTNNCLKNQT